MVSENIVLGSGMYIFMFGFFNGVMVFVGKGIDFGGSLVNNSLLMLIFIFISYFSLKVLGMIIGIGSISYECYINQVGMGSFGGNDLVGMLFMGQIFGFFVVVNMNLVVFGSLWVFGFWDNMGIGFINYDVMANVGIMFILGIGYWVVIIDGLFVIFIGMVQIGNVMVNIIDVVSQWNVVVNFYLAYLSMVDFLNYDYGGGVIN